MRRPGLPTSLLTRLLVVVVVALLPALAVQAYKEHEASLLRHASARAEAIPWPSSPPGT